MMGNSNSPEEIRERLISVYQIYIDKLMKQLSETVLDMNEINVHDLRVLIRRILALSDFINQISESNYYPGLKAELKIILKSLNPLRDSQVQLVKLKRNISSDSPLMEFFYYLLRMEREQLVANKTLLSDELISGINGLSFFFVLDIKGSPEKIIAIEDKVKAIGEKVYSVFDSALKNIIFDDLQTIHKLRLSFKKYRYTIEIIQKLLNLENIRNQDFKHFQNILGAIQDNKILLNRLDEFISQSNSNNDDYQKYHEKMIKQRKQLIETLKKAMNQTDKYSIRLFLPRN